jgi:hypothetical protein
MRLAVIGGIFLLAALATTATLLLRQPTKFTDLSGHTTSFVAVAPDVTLEVLDWAGSGPPLILLSGLGNTAHVFDHFVLADAWSSSTHEQCRGDSLTYCFGVPGSSANHRYPHAWQWKTTVFGRRFSITATG